MLGTLLVSPENMIFEKGEKSNSMLWVTSGDCIVIHTDNFNRLIYKKRLIVRGDHIGEIGCLFNCNRTCSVMSTNYAILARLTKQRLRMVLSDYPGLRTKFMEYIYGYVDPFKTFIYNVFQSIEYLKDVDKEIFHTLLYSL
jgi:CRP-like cAMP-binding protein